MTTKKIRASQICGTIPDGCICGNCYTVSLSFAKSKACSHLLCHVCYTKCYSGNKLCPLCGIAYEDDLSQQDREKLKESISNLSILCPKRCGDAVPFGSLDTHLKSSCIHGLVHCPNVKCPRAMKRKLLQDHLCICDYRSTICEGCGLTMMLGRLDHHEKVHHCVAITQKQKVIREMQKGKRQLHEQECVLKKEQFQIKQFERSREKHYTIGRVNRNPIDYPRTFAISCSEKSKQLYPQVLRSNQQSKSLEPVLKYATCCKCGDKFLISKNNNRSCRWHKGPIMKVFGGMCQACGNLTNKEGCCVGYHEFSTNDQT